MKRSSFLSALFGAVMGVIFATAVGGFSTGLSLLTGPQPGGDIVSILNTLITNINASLSPQGSGTLNSALSVTSNTAAVDYLSMTGGLSASGAVTLGTAGQDTNIDLLLSEQGSGLLKVGVSNTVSNNSVANAQVLASLSLPSGAHTTVQGTLVFKDSTGVSRFVPFW